MGSENANQRSTQDSESQFRRLLEKLPVGAYTCDAAGLITYYNQHAIELWGRAPALNDPVDRFCGSFKLFSADGSPIAHDDCWMARALREGREYNGHEIAVERPDGKRVLALAHANPIWDASGRLIGAVNVLVDVSDRQHALDAQTLLAAIVESSDDAIVSKSLDGRILSWNAGAERLYGYPADEAVGRSITMLVPPDRHAEEPAILERLGRGERIEHFETVRLTKQGRLIDVSVTSSPVRDGAGRVIGASHVARDITSRKLGEENLIALKDQLGTQLADVRRLQEMSVRLSTTLELQPILDETLRTAAAIEGADLGLLSLCDPEHNCLQVGASLGFDEGSLAAVEHVPPGAGACDAAFQQQRRVVVEDVESDPLLAPYREVARRVGFRAVHSTPLVTRSGKVVGVLSTHFRRPHRPSDRETHLIDLCARQAVDFIENARLYAELREADRRKDEFLATLAHELRNPLAPIRNSLQILRMSEDLSPATERVRDIIERQVDHMVRLVDDLLEVSRITRGKIELRKESVDLVTVIRNAVETSKPLIDAAGQQLAITLSPESMMLDADPVRLAQVVANLLNNAAKYTDPGGQIWLTARTEGAAAVISVRDTGVGIPAEMLPRVFEMFAQVNRTLHRAQGGLGIGLTLAKNLIQLHGGSIEAHSEGAGRGSEFVVRLPLATSQAAAAAAPAARGSQPRAPGRRILVVDDLRAAALTLARMLEKMGHEVRVAHDAETGLQMALAQPPELLISDIGMPGIDGHELARRVRQQPSLRGVRLVALTGYGHDRDRQQAHDAGFDHYLVKPADSEDFELLLGPSSSGDALSPGDGPADFPVAARPLP